MREYEWQCVELAMRYLYLAYGIPPYRVGGGKNVVSRFDTAAHPEFEKIQNGTAGRAPQRGDIISFRPTDKFGHVAVVVGSSVDEKTGDGAIQIIEQNDARNGYRTYQLSKWRVKGKFLAINWLHRRTYKLAVTVTPQNSRIYTTDVVPHTSCQDDCIWELPIGSTVSLHANLPSSFTEQWGVTWGGDCSGSPFSAVVEMTSDKSCSATFSVMMQIGVPSLSCRYTCLDCYHHPQTILVDFETAGWLSGPSDTVVIRHYRH